MARFVRANAGRDVFKNMYIEKKNVQSYKEDESSNVLNTEFEVLKEIPVNFEVQYEDNDYKKFWMKYTKPKNFDKDIIEKIELKVKIIDSIIALLSTIIIFICLIEYEIEYYPIFYEKDKSEDEYKGNSIRYLVSILCLILSFFTIISNYLTYRLKIEQSKIFNVSFFGSYYIYRTILEIIIDLVHPVPYLEYPFEFKMMGLKMSYRLHTFLYALILLKSYNIFKIIAIYTGYSNNFCEKYCEEYGTEADTIFALKAIQKDKPFVMLCGLFCSFSLIFGILLRMFEKLHVTNPNKDSDGKNAYDFLANGIWNIIVAMTTVGYGDYYPKTHIGRFIVVFAIILGNLLVSLLVVALSSLIQFNLDESKALAILRKIKMKKNLEIISKKMIALWFVMLKMQGKFPINKQQKTIYKDIPELKEEPQPSKFLIRKWHSHKNLTFVNKEKTDIIIKKRKSGLFNKIQYRSLLKPIEKVKFKRDKDITNNVKESRFKNYEFISMKELIEKKYYTEMRRRMKNLIFDRRELHKLYKRETFSNEEDAILELDFFLNGELGSIIDNIKLLKEFKIKIKDRLSFQKKILTNIEHCIDLNREHIKPSFYKIYFTSDLKKECIEDYEDIDLQDYENIKNIRDQVDKLLFRKSEAITDNDNCGESILKKIYKKVIENNLQVIREKIEDDMNNSMNSLYDKDNILMEYKNMEYLDPSHKEIYKNFSSKTFESLNDLFQIKYKNYEIFGRNVENDLIDQDDSLNDMILGNDKENENSVNEDEPLLNNIINVKLKEKDTNIKIPETPLHTFNKLEINQFEDNYNKDSYLLNENENDNSADYINCSNFKRNKRKDI